MDDLIDVTEYKKEQSVPEIISNNCSKQDINKLETPTDDYQLDNYYRNAMLLFCDHGAWLDDLIRTFQKYRFVIDKYVNLSSFEIEEKCASFFSRNFFEYGAVAVVIFDSEALTYLYYPQTKLRTGVINAGDGKDGGMSIQMEYVDGPGMLKSSDNTYHESVILKYLTTHVPVSLKGKPKIYITKNANVSNRVTIDEYEDILALHLPFETNYRDNYFTKLCKNMETFGENSDLLEIVKDTIQNVQKIKAICEFVGPDYANLLDPFFSGMLPSNNPKKLSSASEDIEEKPKLSCTFKKRFILPSDIYFQQPTLPSCYTLSTIGMENFYY